MHTKLLAISAAVFLMTSSVTAMGNSDALLGGLPGASLIQPELQLAHGDVGGLKRRKVNDLANGPRYGFPATEKKASFGQETYDKRSILASLLSNKKAAPQQPASQSSGLGGEEENEDEKEEENEDEGHHGREAKRALKARRRLEAKRDVQGAAFKTMTGIDMQYINSQKLVTDTEKSLSQLGHTAGGALMSLTEQNKKSTDKPSVNPLASDPPSTNDSDKKSTTTAATADSSKKDATDNAKSTKQDDTGSATSTKQNDTGNANNTPALSPATTTPQAPEDHSSTSGSAEPADNLKINPQYIGTPGDNRGVDSSSNYNGNYFA